jgi:hypothetical protein
MSAVYRSLPATLGVQAFFEKPFDLDDLLATVRELASSEAA